MNTTIRYIVGSQSSVDASVNSCGSQWCHDQTTIYTPFLYINIAPYEISDWYKTVKKIFIFAYMLFSRGTELPEW